MPKILLALLALAVLATEASADMLRCKIEGFEGYVFVTTLPDTNDNDSQYARIGISPGIDNRALVFADLMGPQVFVELNGTEYLRSHEVGKNQSKQSIPSAKSLRHSKVRACVPDASR